METSFLTAAELGKLWYINQCMSVYRKHEGGMVFKYDKVREKKAIKHDLTIIEVFGNSYRKSVHKALSLRLFGIMVSSLKAKDFIFAIISAMRSIYYSPHIFFKKFFYYSKIWMQTNRFE